MQQTKTAKEKKLVGSFAFLLLMLFPIASLTPALTGISTEFVGLVFACSIPALLYFIFSKQDRLFLACVLFSAIYVAIMVVYKVIGKSSCEWFWLASYFCWIGISIISFSSLKTLDRRRLHFLLFAVSIVEIVNEIVLLIASTALINTNAGVEVAITQYGTMLIFYAAISLVWVLKEKSIWVLLINSIGIFLSFYINAFILQRATNVIIFVMAVILIFVFQGKKDVGRRGFIFTCVAFFVVLFSLGTGVFEALMTAVIDAVDSPRIADRFEAILVFLRTGNIEEAGGFSGRYDLIAQSFSTWLSSPVSFLFGVGDHRFDNTLVGNHSDIIDSLARYGLFGSALLFGILVSHFAIMRRELFATNNNSLRYQILGVFFLFVLRNVIGNSFITYVSVPVYFYAMCLVYYQRSSGGRRL